VGLEQLLTEGWASFEHLYGYIEYVAGLRRTPLPLGSGNYIAHADTTHWMQPGYQLDTAKLRRIAVATQRAGVWNCPTLFIVAKLNHPDYPSPFRDPALYARLLPAAPPLRELPPEQQQNLAAQRRYAKRVSDFNLQITKALHDAGAGLLLGTDLSPAGFQIHWELGMLVEAGLSPYAALLTGTRNVAEFLGTLDSAGTVAVGKRADLVLLDANPLADIRHTTALAGVMVGGRWLSRAAIDAQLDAWGTYSSGEGDDAVDLRELRRQAWRPPAASPAGP
jgi:hypothetical protein